MFFNWQAPVLPHPQMHSILQALAHFPLFLRDEEAEAWRFWLSSHLQEAVEMEPISTAGFQLLTTTTK